VSDRSKNGGNGGDGGWAAWLASLIGLKPQHAQMVKLMAIAIALGVLFLSAGDLFGVSSRPGRPSGAVEVARPSGDELTRLEQEYARQLEATLSAVKGAGKVRVSVTLESGPEVVPVLNTRAQETRTQEKAGDGSNRDTTTTNRDVTNVMVQDGQSQNLAVQKRIRARIAGVSIVAEGARDAKVAALLHKVAVTQLGIPAHRVQVAAAEGR
jgi:stage III sporulation protein AG